MNYVGHAHLAIRIDPSPDHVLGSMLPDFAAMCGSRLAHIEHTGVSTGVALHHATDLVFHGLEVFKDFCAEGAEDLMESGLSKASAVAVAHIGFELMLDGYVVGLDGGDLARAYAEGLDAAASTRLGAGIAWRAPGAAAAFESLRAFLRDRGFPTVFRDAGFIASRLEHILARRPRFALEPEQSRVVDRWVRGAQENVLAAAPKLLARLESMLVPEAGRDGDASGPI